MQKLLGCIFDLDGVIVDTAKYHYLAWNRLANEMGFEFNETENEGLKGVSRMRSLDILLEVGGIEIDSEEKKVELATKKNTWYVEYITTMEKDEILDGVIPFLEELRKAKIGISLGSASKNAMTILTGLDILKYFDAVIDGTKTSRAKPDPEVFVLGAKALGVNHSSCVVFEDAAAGVEAANAAGMFSIGVGAAETLGHANWVVPNLASMTLQKLQTAISQKA